MSIKEVTNTDTNDEQEIEEAYKRMTAGNKKHFLAVVLLAAGTALFTTMLFYALFNAINDIELQLKRNANDERSMDSGS